MKRFFVWILIYFWGLGVAVPYISSALVGIFNTGIYNKKVQDIYLHETALILTIVVFASVFLISILPIGQKKLTPSGKMGGWYLYIVAACYIIGQISLGGGNISNAFAANLNGGANGTIGAYVGMAFNFFDLLIIYLICMKQEKKLFLILLLYIGYSLLCASRSGVLNVIFALVLVLVSTDKFLKYKKRIIGFVIICLISAPVIFATSTVNRGSTVGNNVNSILNTLIGRCSQLEVGGIALSGYVNGTYEADIFNEKYGVENQIKQVVNSIVLGDIFEEDVDPNQYYRTAFLDMSEKVAHDNYTSMNLTLPIYLTIKYGIGFGVFFSILLLITFYFICVFWGNKPFGILLAIWVKDLLNYFDWVMIWRSLFSIILTCITLWVVSHFLSNMHINTIKFGRWEINLLDTDNNYFTSNYRKVISND